MKSGVQAFPLAWPPGWKRITTRTRAKFKGAAGGFQSMAGSEQRSWVPGTSVTIAQGTKRVQDELRRFGVSESSVVISSNLQLRLDGLPRSGQPNPQDPGVAVYWQDGKQERCMAIDRYDRVADNLAAIAATLEAMRAIERHGGAAILDRAFTGFAALPAPEQHFQVLGVSSSATRDDVERAYKRLASQHHPDKGGDPQAMARINAARDAMLEDRP
jgi:hypothetical protein